VFRLLERQGYEVAPFLRRYERIAYGLIEALSPPALRLAATAACEHFTAMLAEDALRRRLLDRAHPTMRALLLWHAAEEIEHRAVAFDVLRAVHPSYALRLAGLAMAAICLGGFWIMGTATLLWQERRLGGARMASDWRQARSQRDPEREGLWRGIRDYLRRDFHPSQRDSDGLAAEYLAGAGLA
jgi:predicted metal-dependent hydrolase